MSQVVYNNISLPWVRTESLDSEVVYNGPDYVHTRHTATLDLLVARGTPGTFLPGEQLADALRRIRHALETPRRAFSFKVNDRVVLSADDADDTQNGPLPEVIGITQFVGTESAHIRFRVTIHKRECEGAGNNPPEYLSHRWSESADFGDDFRTAYRRSGQLIIGSDAKRNGRDVESVDEFRYLVVPPIPVGFMFKRSHFDVSPDGLTLAYDVEYEEVDFGGMPPAPAVKADGNCVVSTTNGAKMFAQVNIHLIGHPRTHKGALLATAIAIAMTRLERAGALRGQPGDQWRITGSISEQLYKNEVNVQLNSIISTQDRFPAELRTDNSGFQRNDKTTVTGGVGDILSGFVGGAGAGSVSSVLGFPVASVTGAGLAAEIAAKLLIKPKGKPGDKPEGTGVPKAIVPFGFGEVMPGSSPGFTPDPGLRATAGLKLITALVNDPCQRVQEVELRGVPRQFAELVAQAPGGDLSRLIGGTAARTSTLTARVVPGLAEQVRQQRRRQAKALGSGYTEYFLRLEYSIDPNVAAMAEQRDGGLTHFVPLSAEMVTLTVRWETSRVGDVPAIPERVLKDRTGNPDPNVVFLGGSFSPGDIDLAADGQTLIIRSAGWWRFGFKDPSKVKYGAGMAPWLTALIGGSPKPIVSGGPEFLRPEGPFSELSTVAPVVSAIGDYVPFWRSIWRGFITGIKALTR